MNAPKTVALAFDLPRTGPVSGRGAGDMDAAPHLLPARAAGLHTARLPGDDALEPESAPAQTSQAAPSYSALQSRLASLEQQLPDAARALQVPFAGVAAADAVQPAGGACVEASAARRADLLAEELTCILEFLNAQVGRTHIRLVISRVCVC